MYRVKDVWSEGNAALAHRIRNKIVPILLRAYAK
jgi:hypothetical protein